MTGLWMNAHGEFVDDPNEKPRFMKLRYDGRISFNAKAQAAGRRSHEHKRGNVGERMECEWCHKVVTRKRRDQRCCSKRCSSKLYYEQNRKKRK